MARCGVRHGRAIAHAPAARRAAAGTVASAEAFAPVRRQVRAGPARVSGAVPRRFPGWRRGNPASSREQAAAEPATGLSNAAVPGCCNRRPTCARTSGRRLVMKSEGEMARAAGIADAFAAVGQPARIVPTGDDRVMPVPAQPERLAADPNSALTSPAERIAPPSGRPNGGAAGTRLRAIRRDAPRILPGPPPGWGRAIRGGLRRRIRVSDSRHWKIQLAPGGRVPT